MIGVASSFSLELGVEVFPAATALTLGAKALKSPVVPSEGLPHKKKPAGRDRRPFIRTCQSKGKAAHRDEAVTAFVCQLTKR